MTVIDAPPRPPDTPPPPPRQRISFGGFRPGGFGRGSAAGTAAPASPLRKSLRASLVILAGLMAWTLLYALLLTPLQNHHDQGVLYSKFRQELAEETAPLGGVISKGAPIAIMDAPAAGIKREIVVEGTTSSNLAEGPGHLRNTVLPGQPGLSVLMGRAQLFGAPFGSIASMPVGSTITFVTAEGVSKYTVLDVRHVGDVGAAPIPSGGGGLWLVTSSGSGWRSGWAPSNVVYVDATLTSKPYGTVSGGLSLAPKSEQPMKGDPSSLYVLVLWLPLLLGAVVLVFWAYGRWGRWQAWVCGGPVLLAALWGVSKVAVQLLPNLT